MTLDEHIRNAQIGNHTADTKELELLLLELKAYRSIMTLTELKESADKIRNINGMLRGKLC